MYGMFLEYDSMGREPDVGSTGSETRTPRGCEDSAHSINWSSRYG